MGYTNERKEFVGMTPLRKQMIEELQLRNLSETTIHTYVHAVERYAKHFNTSPAKLGPEQVREYLLYLLNNHHVSSSTIQVNRGALKFLYVKTLKQRWFDDEIPYPKKQVRLPDVIRADDIARILDRTSNLKKRDTKRILAIQCPTCGAKPGAKCELNTGQLRNTPHVNRRLAVK